jgi:hypothetical protein
MLHLPPKGEPTRWRWFLTSLLLFVPLGWIELTRDGERPVSVRRTAIWLGLSLLAGLAFRRMIVTRTETGHAPRATVRVLRVASPAVLIAIAIAMIAFFALTVAVMPPADAPWEMAVPAIVMVGGPLFLVRRVMWELRNPEEPDAEALAEVTPEIERAGARVAAALGLLLATGGGTYFGLDAINAYHVHGPTHGAFIARGATVAFMVLFGARQLIVLITGRPMIVEAQSRDESGADHR